VLVAGPSGSGKSYLAGAILEQLARQEYSTLVIDPEGDHGATALLPGVVVLGGTALPGAEVVARLMTQAATTVVLDLSELSNSAFDALLLALQAELAAGATSGAIPHWIVLDEAHKALGRDSSSLGLVDVAGVGNCLVTWRPADLSAAAIARLDTVIGVSDAGELDAATVDVAAAVGSVEASDVARAAREPGAKAVVTSRSAPGRLTAFTLTQRQTPHVRHEHRYDHGAMPTDRRFFLRSVHGATGASVGSLGELEAALTTCDRAVLRHHLPRRDLSRWVDLVLHERRLAAEINDVEREITDSTPAALVDAARVQLISVLRTRDCRPVSVERAGRRS
jgi:hypothetical protein